MNLVKTLVTILKRIQHQNRCNNTRLLFYYQIYWVIFKAADLQMLKKMKIILKLTVNTGQVMFSGEIYYYLPLNSSDKVDKNVGKTYFFA